MRLLALSEDLWVLLHMYRNLNRPSSSYSFPWLTNTGTELSISLDSIWVGFNQSFVSSGWIQPAFVLNFINSILQPLAHMALIHVDPLIISIPLWGVLESSNGHTAPGTTLGFLNQAKEVKNNNNLIRAQCHEDAQKYSRGIPQPITGTLHWTQKPTDSQYDCTSLWQYSLHEQS